MPEPLSIFEASELIHRGELTPSELLEQCLHRVEEYEYNVRAWVHLDRKRAREEAARFTEEIKAGLSRGPLHGIPVGIKDIIDVFDMPTSCGSKRWANSYARQDARCVTKLRNAGAVIMGKTVTTAYAFLDPPPTRNPWNNNRTPGGSSSGSAAAVACGMCLGALGSQTGGSLTRPASYCGIVSLKPTYGRVSVDGVLPLAPSLDHIGCMARCVRDLPILFDAIASKATMQESGISQPSEMLDDPFTPINVLTGMFDSLLEPDCRTRFLDELPTLFKRSFGVSAGHGFQVPLAGFNDLPGFHKTIMAYEAATYHGSRFERHPDDYPPRIRELIIEGLETSEFAYHEANRNRIALANEFNETLKGMFAVTSATVGPAPDISTTGSPALNSPWSYLGLPTISVPFARDKEGMPLSIQLIGRRGSETRLLQTAIECEKRLNVRMGLPPRPSRTAKA